MLALFGKHAALIFDGLLAQLHKASNTENVRSCCATAGKVDGAFAQYNDDVDGDGTTVPCDSTAVHACTD